MLDKNIGNQKAELHIRLRRYLSALISFVDDSIQMLHPYYYIYEMQMKWTQQSCTNLCTRQCYTIFKHNADV